MHGIGPIKFTGYGGKPAIHIQERHACAPARNPLGKRRARGRRCKLQKNRGLVCTLQNFPRRPRIPIPFGRANQLIPPASTGSSGGTRQANGSLNKCASPERSARTNEKIRPMKTSLKVVSGKPNGQPADLKLSANLVFDYDEINGVNIVNRIAPADGAKNSSYATGSLSASGPTTGY